MAGWPPLRTSTRLEFPVRQCSGFLWLLPGFNADERPTNSEMTVVSIVTTLVLEPVGASSSGGDRARASGHWKHGKAKFDVVQCAVCRTANALLGSNPGSLEMQNDLPSSGNLETGNSTEPPQSGIVCCIFLEFFTSSSRSRSFFAGRRGSYRPISLRPLRKHSDP